MKVIFIFGTGRSLRTLPSNFGDILLKKVSLSILIKQGVQSYIDCFISSYKEGSLKVDGVLGLTDSSTLIASIISEELGFKYASFKSIIDCSLKSFSRSLMLENLYENTPNVYSINSLDLKFPLFLKPNKGSLSFFTYRVGSIIELNDLLLSWSSKRNKNNFYNSIIQYSSKKVSESDVNSLILEDLLPISKGTQITVDGVIESGNIQFFGITESVFYNNTNSFKEFNFPYSFSRILDKKIFNLCKKIVQVHKLNNSLFNIELLIHKNTIRFIEINPRTSAQFVWMIDNVLGHNPIEIAVKLVAKENFNSFFISTGDAINSSSANLIPSKKNSLKKNPLKKATCFILRAPVGEKVPKPNLVELKVVKDIYKTDIQIGFFKKTGILKSINEDLVRYAQIKIISSSFKRNKKILKDVTQRIYGL